MFSDLNTAPAGSEKPDGPDMHSIIADFLDMGLVENMVSLCKQEPEQIAVSAALVGDERLRVRLGLAVLFEELQGCCADDLTRAVPVLMRYCSHAEPWARGDPASLLASINSPEVLPVLQSMQNDPSPQVAALIRDLLQHA